MAKRQFFGLHYPFTDDEYTKFFVDVNMKPKDKIRSQIMHVIFTPKGQRIRNPEFGTDLIKYIFEPNDVQSWNAVKSEISETVNRWVPGCSIKDIQVAMSNDDRHEIYVRIDYSVKNGNQITDDTIITQI